MMPTKTVMTPVISIIFCLPGLTSFINVYWLIQSRIILEDRNKVNNKGLIKWRALRKPTVDNTVNIAWPNNRSWHMGAVGKTMSWKINISNGETTVPEIPTQKDMTKAPTSSLICLVLKRVVLAAHAVIANMAYPNPSLGTELWIVWFMLLWHIGV